MKKQFTIPAKINERLFMEKVNDKFFKPKEENLRSIKKFTNDDMRLILSIISLSKRVSLLGGNHEDAKVKFASFNSDGSIKELMKTIPFDLFARSDYTLLKFNNGPKYLFAFMDNNGENDFYLYTFTPLKKNRGAKRV